MLSKVPSNWINPSGTYFCGQKALFDLCSSLLKTRMKKERKERFWQPFNDEALVNIQKKLNNISNKPKESSDSKTSNEESLSISVLSSNKGDDSGVSISTQISVKQPGGVKKNSDTVL